MSCPATNITGFNKSKEDFIWFIKKATADKKSDAHSELYHCLLKMSKLIDMAASIPRMYGYAPVDSELYKTEQEKEQARTKMFDSMDLKSTGMITFDEWYKFSMEHILAKTATLDPHPILDHGNMEQFKTFLKAALTIGSPENNELYWFLLELFTEYDTNKNGIVTMSDFPAMLDMVLETPKKLTMDHPDKVGGF
jgi:Ca2+-binding EF-hand superfamily protein